MNGITKRCQAMWDEQADVERMERFGEDLKWKCKHDVAMGNYYALENALRAIISKPEAAKEIATAALDPDMPKPWGFVCVEGYYQGQGISREAGEWYHEFYATRAEAEAYLEESFKGWDEGKWRIEKRQENESQG